MFMAPIRLKTRVSARGKTVGRVHENAILPRLFLTFGDCGGLTPPLLEKTFFSIRRPALEAGGQRPTARCALGRKSVWNICLARRETYNEPSSPAKAGDPVSAASPFSREASAYWIS